MAIKIFSVAKWDYAACGYFLSEAINATTEHHSRAVRMHESLFGFPFDALNLADRRLRALWDWADIIHIHDASGIENIMTWPRKPTVLTLHGTRYRRGYEGFHRMIKTRGWLGTVATPDLTQFGLDYLPDCRPDLSEYYDPPDQFTVVHAPSKRHVKGTDRVIAACEQLGVDLVLIENTPYQKCLELKGRADVLVDQFELGYGCNAIEAWAMGMPVIADALPAEERAIKNQFDYLPYARAGNDLADALDRMKQDEDWRQDMADLGRGHYLKWHAPKPVAKRALELYRQAARVKPKEAPPPRPNRMQTRLKRGKLVLTRYLGASAGKQSWFGSETNHRYIFSSTHREGYVYEQDLDTLLEQSDERQRPLFEVVK